MSDGPSPDQPSQHVTEPTSSQEHASMSASLASLIERYATDERFNSHEAERRICTDTIIGLNDVIHQIDIPSNIKAIVLTGSLSEKKESLPSISYETQLPEVDLLLIAPDNAIFFHVTIHSESDIAKVLLARIRQGGFVRAELDIATANRTPSWLNNMTDDLISTMLNNGTLIYGDLPAGSYGKDREGGKNYELYGR